jgi:hypothetical protein
MKSTLVLSLFVLAIPATASADEVCYRDHIDFVIVDCPEPAVSWKNPFETQTLVSAGLPTYAPTSDGKSQYNLATVRMAQTLRAPKFSGIGIEINAIPLGGRGIGASLIIDLLRFENFRIHADLGAFWNLGEPVSVISIKRAYDLTVGGGLELKVSERLGVSVDWRAYLPEPGAFLRYGDLAIPAYKNALKGGQACLGVLFYW